MGLFDTIIGWGSAALDWGKSAITSSFSSDLAQAAIGAAVGAAASYGAAQIFGGGAPSPPAIPEIPDMPRSILESGRGSAASQAVARAEDKQRAALAANRGRGATNLTGPLGLEYEAPVERRTLLGA